MLQERFEFRSIDPGNAQEVDHTIYMEDVCMPPGEGCTRDEILDRVCAAPEMFLLAVDTETGEIAGYVNGVATNESVIRDEFFRERLYIERRKPLKIKDFRRILMPICRLFVA